MGYRVLFVDDDGLLMGTVDVPGRKKFDAIVALVRKAARR